MEKDKVFTHLELEYIVKKWLLKPISSNGPNCNCSFNEIKNNINNEIVDVIGFKQGGVLAGSVLVEVKTSRSDFLVDAKKPHRLDPSLGMGKYRYFAAPEGLIKVDELPEKWGLIEITAKGKVKYITGHLSCKKGPNQYLNLDKWQFNNNLEAENSLLVILLSKMSNFDNIKHIKELNKFKSLTNKLSKEIYDLRKKSFFL